MQQQGSHTNSQSKRSTRSLSVSWPGPAPPHTRGSQSLPPPATQHVGVGQLVSLQRGNDTSRWSMYIYLGDTRHRSGSRFRTIFAQPETWDRSGLRQGHGHRISIEKRNATVFFSSCAFPSKCSLFSWSAHVRIKWIIREFYARDASQQRSRRKNESFQM